MIDQCFVKKVKIGEETKIDPIFDNLQGLCDYLTASNIKNKVKHPLYIAIKFSSCIKLYYNKNMASLNVIFYLFILENVFIGKFWKN